ncbi:MAG: hypothetical protein KAQ85_09155 [Thermodesulfovibrionia bacterium]|nr:hypothetical protein [Thermodesulfovibrionia bacterium]
MTNADYTNLMNLLGRIESALDRIVENTTPQFVNPAVTFNEHICEPLENSTAMICKHCGKYCGQL